MPRYLTKSRFKLALDCPAKLFYTGKGNTLTLPKMMSSWRPWRKADTRWVHWLNATTLTA